MRRWLVVAPLVALAAAPDAQAQRRPVLHEPIPFDPREDVALSVSLDGDLPAAIQTPHGLVPAPDPTRPVGDGPPYGQSPRDDVPDASFYPDRDTRRPDVLPYDEPFSPSTAPFKRLSAFDMVDASYALSVRDTHGSPLAVSPTPPPTEDDERFYADMVVDLTAGQRVRIPSVGPGARVLRARAGVGTRDVRFQLLRDGAENWFIESESTVRARLVMELAIPRSAFGGEFASPSWGELPPVPLLPLTVQRSAREVAARIGVSRRMSPREVVTKLVGYFRAFNESEEPPPPSRDIYLDLALSQKGVCRHRSFAFMVTALSLGIPTRMVVNEAHAWVEVNDGRAWRRIDLGGAGRTLHDPLSTNVPHEPPPDTFAWPQGAARGDDLAERARHAAPPPSTPPPNGNSGDAGTPAGATDGQSSGSSGAPYATQGGADGEGEGEGDLTGPGEGGRGAGPGEGGRGPTTPDTRPQATVTLGIADDGVMRGAPVVLRGRVTADGEPCPRVTVEIVLRGRSQEIAIGRLATKDDGGFDGTLVVPSSVPLGDYDVQARTSGDTRCGAGRTR